MTVSLKNPKTSRLSWDETFMNLAFLTSKRSSCRFHETGAVFVDSNKRIISLGYNGPTEHDLHCIEKGCAKVDGDPITGKLKRCRGAHAEINAIINAQDSTRLRGATLYTVVFPCYDCMKALNNAGIKEIVYNEIYKRIQTGGEHQEEENEAWELARQRGIIARQYNSRNFYNDDPKEIPEIPQSRSKEQLTEDACLPIGTEHPRKHDPKANRIGVTGFIYNQGKVLIIKRSSEESFLPEYYELVGGKLDNNETLEKGLEREIREETGLNVQITKPYSAFGYSTEEANTVDIQYVCIPTSPIDQIRISPAHTDYKWITENEIDNYQISNEMKKVIRKGFETVKLNSLPNNLPFEKSPKPTKTPEHQYLDLMQDILDNGSDKKLFFTPEVLQQYKDRGVQPPHIRSLFGRQIRFNMADGFPLLTTKKTFARGIIEELIWFLSGSSNIKYLVDRDVHIWDEWAYKAFHKHCQKNAPQDDMEQKDFIAKLKSLPENDPFVTKWGDLTTIYGRMWRRWPASDGREIDQLGWVIDGLREKPFRKSYVVSAWNPDFIYAMASENNKNEVPPFCHTTYQFAVTGGNKLNLGLYQRSADVFLGVPFNIASYALLLLMVAQATGLQAGEFVHTFGDVHGYSNHFDQMKEQISRSPRPWPKMTLNPNVKNIDDFKYEDFKLEGYDPHPQLKAEIANIGGY